MDINVKAFLAWARQHEGEEWTTLKQGRQFRYRVTRPGIEYIPESGIPRPVPFSELESFCAQFEETRSFSPGRYPNRWHKSYSLPLFKRYLSALGEAPARTEDA